MKAKTLIPETHNWGFWNSNELDRFLHCSLLSRSIGLMDGEQNYRPLPLRDQKPCSCCAEVTYVG